MIRLMVAFCLGALLAAVLWWLVNPRRRASVDLAVGLVSCILFGGLLGIATLGAVTFASFPHNLATIVLVLIAIRGVVFTGKYQYSADYLARELAAIQEKAAAIESSHGIAESDLYEVLCRAAENPKNTDRIWRNESEDIRLLTDEVYGNKFPGVTKQDPPPEDLAIVRSRFLSEVGDEAAVDTPAMHTGDAYELSHDDVNVTTWCAIDEHGNVIARATSEEELHRHLEERFGDDLPPYTPRVTPPAAKEFSGRGRRRISG